jgi:hypothetical protein
MERVALRVLFFKPICVATPQYGPVLIGISDSPFARQLGAAGVEMVVVMVIAIQWFGGLVVRKSSRTGEEYFVVQQM